MSRRVIDHSGLILLVQPAHRAFGWEMIVAKPGKRTIRRLLLTEEGR